MDGWVDDNCLGCSLHYSGWEGLSAAQIDKPYLFLYSAQFNALIVVKISLHRTQAQKLGWEL